MHLVQQLPGHQQPKGIFLRTTLFIDKHFIMSIVSCLMSFESAVVLTTLIEAFKTLKTACHKFSSIVFYNNFVLVEVGIVEN